MNVQNDEPSRNAVRIVFRLRLYRRPRSEAIIDTLGQADPARVARAARVVKSGDIGVHEGLAQVDLTEL